MYWIWANEPSDEDEAMLYGVPPVIEQRNLSFDDGILIRDKVPLIEFVRDDDSQGRLTDNLIAPGSRGLMFSSRLRAVLESVGADNIQYFPTRIENPANSTSTEDYMLANLIGRIECIDTANSDLQMHPHHTDRIEFVDSLILDKDKINNLKLFRTSEHSQIIVAHNVVKEICEKNGISGIVFYEPQEFTM